MPSWDDLEPVTDSAPSWDALRPMTSPPPQAPPSSPSYLGRIAELTGERWREQGSNIGNVLKGVGGAAASIPTRDTPMPPISAGIPGSNILEKGLNLVRLIPHVAALEAGLAPIGAAIQTGAERLGGVSPEKSREVSNYLELATTLPISFARTGPGLLSRALQSVGVGRPSEAAEAAARTAVMQRKYPGGVGPDLPLTPSEQWLNEYDAIPLSERLRGVNLAPPEGVPVAPPLKAKQQAVLRTRNAAEAKAANAAQAAARVEAARMREGGLPVQTPASPEAEALNRRIGQATEARLQAEQQAAEQARAAEAEATKRLINMAPPEGVPVSSRVEGARGYTGPSVQENPEIALLARNRAAAEGRLLVPPGPMQRSRPSQATPVPPQAKAGAPITSLVDTGTVPSAALRPLVEPTPVSQTLGVPLVKPKGRTKVVAPIEAVDPTVATRLTAIQSDANRSTRASGQPYGRQYGSVETEMGGQKRAIGDAEGFVDQFAPLYPELQELQGLKNVGPKAIAEAIKKDKGNKLYTMIKDASARQVEREAADEAAGAASRAALAAEEEAYIARLAAEDAGVPPVTPPVGTQPKLFKTQAEMPPTPLQAKTAQVPHEELLGGFRKPEPPSPELPLGGRVSESQPTMQTVRPGSIQEPTAASTAERRYVPGNLRPVDKSLRGQVLLAAQEAGFTGEGSVLHKGDDMTLVVRPEGSWTLQDFRLPKGQRERLGYGIKDIQDVIGTEPSGVPSGEVELGMGLPIPKSVKDWTRRFLTGEEKPGAKAHGWLTDWTIFNRALGVDPATKKPIGDLVNNSILTTMQIEGKKNNAVGKTLLLSNRGKEAVLNEAENVNLMRVMEGKERPMNARVAEAADVLIPELAQDSAIYTKEGAQILRDAVYDTKTGATIRENQWVPYQGLKNYYPHYPDPTLIVKYSADEGAKLILRDYPKMPRATAQDLATAILAEAKGESIPQSVGKGARELLQLGQPQATHLHARSPNFTYPEEFRMRPNKAIPRYNEASATELGYLLNLGPRDAKIEQALGRARASGRSDVGVAQSAWNHLRNRAVIDPLGTTTKKVVQLGKNLTTATLLGINTAVKQTSQAGMHFFGDTRMRHSLATLGKAFTKGGKSEAREMGALIEDMRSQLELQNPIHWGILPKDTLLDKAVKYTGRLATGVVTKTGSIPMDTLWRTWSALASKRDFLAYQREAAKGSNKAVSMLKRFDLTPTSPLADIERAAQKLSHRTNLRADTMTIPGVFYRDTTASLLSSLQKFNISIVSKIRKEFVAPMAKALYAKDRAEAMYQAKRTAKFLAGMGITGEVIADTLTTIQGRSDDRPGGSLVEFIQGALNGDVSPETAVRRFGENLVTAGTFGALQVIQGALYAQGGAREKQGRIAGAFVGAVVGSAAEAGGHAADLLTASREPNENTGISPHDRAKSNALRALLSRVPGTRPFSGMVVPKVGELLGLPKMKTPRAKVRTEAAIERATKRRDSEAVSEWAQWYRQQQ